MWSRSTRRNESPHSVRLNSEIGSGAGGRCLRGVSSDVYYGVYENINQYM